MKFRIPLIFSVLAVGLGAQTGLERQLQDLDRRLQREQQKIDQAEEQERIKLRTRQRDELRARSNARRMDIENTREEEMAKVGGG